MNRQFHFMTVGLLGLLVIANLTVLGDTSPILCLSYVKRMPKLPPRDREHLFLPARHAELPEGEEAVLMR